MITSISPELEEKIRASKEQNSDKESLTEIFSCLEECVAVGEVWLVPAKFVAAQDEAEAGTDEAPGEDEDEGITVKGLENFRILHGYTVRDGVEYPLLAAFSSREQLENSSCGLPPVTISLKAKDILELALAQEEVLEFSLNPGCDQFRLNKQAIEMILQHAENLPRKEILKKLSYLVEPKSVIDTNRILAEWKNGWTDEGNIEDWELKEYPIMADGTVLLVFEMAAEIYDGTADHYYCAHKEMYYRVLHYDLSGEPKLLNRYRFKVQDGDLGTCYIRDGILHAVMSTRFTYSYNVLQVYPNDDGAQFRAGNNVKRFIVRSDGRAVAGYDGNQKDKDHAPVVFFNPEGEVNDVYRDGKVLECRGLALDGDENVWAYLHPSDCLYEFDEEKREAHEMDVALQGFDNFGLTDDLSKLIVSFDEDDDWSVFYVMQRNGSCKFTDPVEFAFQPKDADGNEIDMFSCYYFGCPSILKNTMILRADGILYVYDLNDFCDGKRENLLGLDEIGRKEQIEIDSSDSESDTEPNAESENLAGDTGDIESGSGTVRGALHRHAEKGAGAVLCS